MGERRNNGRTKTVNRGVCLHATNIHYPSVSVKKRAKCGINVVKENSSRKKIIYRFNPLKGRRTPLNRAIYLPVAFRFGKFISFIQLSGGRKERSFQPTQQHYIIIYNNKLLLVDVVSFCVAVNCARRNLSESVGNELENCSLPSMVIVVSLYCDSPQKH